MTVRARIRYGKQWLELQLPPGTCTLTGASVPALPDPLAAVRAALQSPIASPSFARIVREKKPASVAITISDITRPVPNQPIVTALLERLNEAGVRDEQVVIIIATGMHRPSTPAERSMMLGDDLLNRVEVIDHVADDPAGLVQISNDPPVSVNARFMRSGLRVVTGLIEPHFMAGYSGGRKGVCPGLVDLRTVQRFHGYHTMADPRSTEGVLAGNPCHEIATRVASAVGVDFLVNVAITQDRRMAAVYAGDLAQAHEAGCRDVQRWTSAEIDRPFDLVVTSSGGFPLDQNFYQSVKGMVTALPALHERSTLLIASTCHEIGSPEYSKLMLEYSGDWRRFLADIATRPDTAKDQWQFQLQARVLERIGVDRLHMANDVMDLALQRKLAVTPLEDEGDAAARAQRFIDRYCAANPQARVAVIPEGPYTMLHRV